MTRSLCMFVLASAATVGVAQVSFAEEAENELDEVENEPIESDDGLMPEEPLPEREYTPEDLSRRAGTVAKVGDYGITVGDFEDRLNKQGPFRRVQYSTPEKRREFLDQMIEWELQAQEADRRGLGEDAAVSEQIKRVMSSLLLRREVDDRVRPQDVTAEELQAYYQEHNDTFHRPERVRAYHIVIADQVKAQNLLKRLLDEDVDTREFRRLAREMSEDPVTKRRGGDLRYFTKQAERAEGDPEVPEPVVDAAFELLAKRRTAMEKAQKNQKVAPDDPEKAAPGQATIEGFNPVYPKLVKTSQGFHIVRFMGHREAVNREFPEVERQIRNRIWREKLQTSRESFIEGLREKHRVVINSKSLDLVKVESAPRGPAVDPLKRGIRPRKAPSIEGPIERGPAPEETNEPGE